MRNRVHNFIHQIPSGHNYFLMSIIACISLTYNMLPDTEHTTRLRCGVLKLCVVNHYYAILAFGTTVLTLVLAATVKPSKKTKYDYSRIKSIIFRILS